MRTSDRPLFPTCFAPPRDHRDDGDVFAPLLWVPFVGIVAWAVLVWGAIELAQVIA